MNPSYTFWYETYAGTDYFEHQLTKRQAVIKFNKLQRKYNPEIKRFGWVEEKNTWQNIQQNPTPNP
jgi:hypothetical protein